MSKSKDNNTNPLCTCYNCCYVSSRSVIVCEENSMKISFNNNQQQKILKLNIDGCLLPKDTQPARCDYYVCTTQIEYFIELKGSDVGKAIDQITGTISNRDLLKKIEDNKQNIALNPSLKEGYIICSKSPGASSTDMTKLVKHNKSSSTKIRVHTRQHQITIV